MGIRKKLMAGALAAGTAIGVSACTTTPSVVAEQSSVTISGTVDSVEYSLEDRVMFAEHDADPRHKIQPLVATYATASSRTHTPQQKVHRFFKSNTDTVVVDHTRYLWGSDSTRTALSIQFDDSITDSEIDALLEEYTILESHQFSHRHVPGFNIVQVAVPHAQAQQVVTTLSQNNSVQHIGPIAPALSPTNYISRDASHVPHLKERVPGLTGKGVKVGVHDGGRVPTPEFVHPDLVDRVIDIDDPEEYSGNAGNGHALHVACTIMGDGTFSEDFLIDSCGSEYVDYARQPLCNFINFNRFSGTYDVELAQTLMEGVAPGATGFSTIQRCDEYCLFETPIGLVDKYLLHIQNGVVIINNSISSNASSNGFPCEINGGADLTSRIVDGFVNGEFGNQPLMIVYAAGNERSSGRCVDGLGFDSLGSPAGGSKNAFIVAALAYDDDGNLELARYSSIGPSDDGRIGVTVAAFGGGNKHLVWSCYRNVDNTPGYGRSNGTSMAAPNVSGVLALLQEYATKNGIELSPELAKAAVVNGAMHIYPGKQHPNFFIGFGAVNADHAQKTLENRLFIAGSLSTGEKEVFYVHGTAPLFGSDGMKVSKVTRDHSSTAGAEKELVNDIDLEVHTPGDTTLLPVVPVASDPDGKPIRKRDDLNNVEQVMVPYDEADNSNKIYKVTVSGYDVPTGEAPFAVASNTNIYTLKTAAINVKGAGVFADVIIKEKHYVCDWEGNQCVFEEGETILAQEQTFLGETTLLKDLLPDGYQPHKKGYTRLEVSVVDANNAIKNDINGKITHNFDFYVK